MTDKTIEVDVNAIVEELKELAERGTDPERDHARADEILMDFVRTLGFAEVAAAFDKIEKWYA